VGRGERKRNTKRKRDVARRDFKICSLIPVNLVNLAPRRSLLAFCIATLLAVNFQGTIGLSPLPFLAGTLEVYIRGEGRNAYQLGIIGGVIGQVGAHVDAFKYARTRRR